MQSAQYFLDQAERCLQVARQLSDRKAAENLRDLAKHYRLRASDVEAVRLQESPTPP
jgi:hypothetical protein